MALLQLGVAQVPVQQRRHRRWVERGVLAGEHAEQLRPVGERDQHRAQRRRGLTPRGHLLTEEADRLTGLEAAVEVVAGGGRDGAGAQPRERLVQRLRVLLQRAVPDQLNRGGETRLLAERGHHEHLLVGELRGALGGHYDVGGARQHEHLLGRHLVDRG